MPEAESFRRPFILQRLIPRRCSWKDYDMNEQTKLLTDFNAMIQAKICPMPGVTAEDLSARKANTRAALLALGKRLHGIGGAKS